MSGFTVAIVGRPNVGKSTLFNRLLEQRLAIVDDTSGVTRDRQYGIADWNGKTFNVVDTGGFVPRSEDVFEREIRKQVIIAIQEADLLVFLCDVATGITDLDQEMARLLRKSSAPVLVVVNKVDNPERMLEASTFYRLGFPQVFFLSAISGSGTGELLDEIASRIPQDQPGPEAGDLPRFAIIGQPNVGKSSLVNLLVGNERQIVSDIPGTTRDSIHTRYQLFQHDFILIDTAGIRRKNKVHQDLEFYSVIRAIKAMDDSDVCLLLLDAQQGMTAQDLSIFGLAAKKGKGIVILVNKWDLMDKETNTARDYTEKVRERLAPFQDVPVLFTSVPEKTRIFKALETAIAVYENRSRKIPTSRLNEVIQESLAKFHPPVVRGNPVKIKYVTQVTMAPPGFAFFCNFPDDIRLPYQHYLENQLRSNFDFQGVPIRLFFRKK